MTRPPRHTSPTRDRSGVAVVHDGARLHYAVPIALQRAGLLRAVYTDWYAPPGSWARRLADTVGRLSPAAGRRMADRFAGDLDPAKVRRHPWLGLAQPLLRWRFAD